MVEFTDANIPVTCAECDYVIEGVPAMEQHVREAHHNYKPEEITSYVRDWADSAYEQIDAENAWRTEEYRRTGIDPEDIDRDPL